MAKHERRTPLAVPRGAEGWSQVNTGRALTVEQFEGVVRRFSY
jgi:hypothetical protein